MESQNYLGIEGGGTRTTVVLADAKGQVLKEAVFGPANLRLMSDGDLRERLGEINKRFPKVSGIGIGLAGARTESQWKKVEKAASAFWKKIPIQVTHDLEIAWAAGQTTKSRACVASILILSGTGSCVYGKSLGGDLQRLGGWGHLLGDKGSGYEIGLRGLKAVVFYHDLDGRWTRLGESLLAATGCNEPIDFIDWVQAAPKGDVAALAKVLFEAAAKRDPIARDILEGAVGSLAKDAVRVAKKLNGKDGPTAFVFAGSVLTEQAGFRKKVQQAIKAKLANVHFSKSDHPSVMGAVRLAMEIGQGVIIDESNDHSESMPWDAAYISESPTEQRHEKSRKLHRMSIARAVDLFLDEEDVIAEALRTEKKSLAKGVRWVAESFKKRGRLFYVGAGTSGRLGVLDASECPPTFRSDPEQVQGIIAGGHRALANAVEGAEDDPQSGANAIEYRGVTDKDTVVGIAASGRTPFVWGALWEARKRGARTVMVCFNPNLHLTKNQRPDLMICPAIGSELLTGSTRLKSGTATKLILNILTTLAMVQTGKVVENLMIDVKPSNVKLRNRAVRIIQELTGLDAADAQKALERSGWSVLGTWKKWNQSKGSKS